MEDQGESVRAVGALFCCPVCQAAITFRDCHVGELSEVRNLKTGRKLISGVEQRPGGV